MFISQRYGSLGVRVSSYDRAFKVEVVHGLLDAN